MSVDVDHGDLGRTVAYPAPPLVAEGAARTIARRPPRIGEHDDEIFGPGPGG